MKATLRKDKDARNLMLAAAAILVLLLCVATTS